MKQILTIFCIILLVACTSVEKESSVKKITTFTYEENWESLEQYEIPQWMKDVKFGIFIHWGPNSVAELHTDWYPHWMYLDDGIVNPQTGEVINDKPHPAVAYHREKFGDQKEFGYKDLIPMFKMEKFNPKEWVELFKDAGAQYVIPVAEHHDSLLCKNLV